MTAPGQIFMARAWAETFTAPDERENVVEYVRKDVAEAAVAAAVQAERARCAAMFHDEQVRIWSEEILGNLGVEGVLDLTNYEAKLDAVYAVKRGLGLIAAAIRAGGA
jgi:hypothetical protein